MRAANASLAVDDGTFLQLFISRGDVPLRALIEIKVSADGEVEVAFLPSPLGLRLRYKSTVAFVKPDALVQEL